MHVSPVVSGLGTYPFVRLDEAKARVAASGVEIIDFGMGDPREPTPRFIQDALAAALPETSGYPRAAGLPELREAIAGWCRRRFGVDLDADAAIIPTYGSKEAIFSLAQIVVDAAADRDLVAYTEPGYPVPERGAVVAGAQTLALPLRADNDFLPDLDAIDDETWNRLALFWVNYPNNPTGATAPLHYFARLAELARRHDFVLASDEAYSEIWFDDRPASALQIGDLSNVLVFNTLSKRSSMTGYRSGFAAGDRDLIGALRAFRPNAGTAPQEFVQRASIAAWSDEAHVEATRDLYRRKRELFLELFARRGITVAGSRAGMYLWLEVPAGETAESFAERLLESGIVVAPGSYFGDAGEGYVRLALVQALEDCRRAVAILDELL